MSEELLQRDLLTNPEKIGNWDFYNIGATSLKALKEHGIIRSINYGKEERKKIDALIVQNKNVIAVIEYKRPSQFKTKEQKNKAIKQELLVAKKLNAHIIIATDTKETIWVNVLTGNRIKNEDGSLLISNFEPRDEKTPKLIEKIKNSINELNDQIKPKQLVNPTDLAKQIWQDIWSVSGATPENCLYTFVELFIFKYLSDLNVLKGTFSFNTLYDSFKTNTEEEVLETYASVIRPKIKDLFPESRLDNTTIINGTIFVSKDQKAVEGYSTVFKKILGKFNDYGKLEHIDYDFKSQLFESFLKESISKKNWGQFFTPLKVVRAIVEMAKDEIKSGAKICDPACGVGKLLLEPIATKIEQLFEVKNGKLESKITIHGFDKGFDKDEQKTIILAKANMLIYFSDLIKENSEFSKQFSTLFNESFILKTNSILGTLSDPINDYYDLILTNPPYVTSGTSNLKEEIKKSGLEYHYNQNAVGVEGLFMEWIIKSLKPGGKGFIVIPDGVLSRNSDKKLREFILSECIIDSIISLPSKTFFTTLKKTYILAVTKKINKVEKQNEPIFSYLVSNIGETLDTYRLEVQENDLNEAVILFNQFKGSKNHFKSNDPRCKSIPSKWFIDELENSWIIENLWNEKELISLGIKEKENIIKVDEFSTYLANLSQTINEYQEQLDNISSVKNKYKEIKLTDEKYFEIVSGGLGMKRDEYAVLDTENESNTPIYTATLNPVAYFKENSVKRKPNEASIDKPHISFASDGDGTAGTNIVFHQKPYFINTSRLAFKITNDKIDAEYIFFSIQDIKKKYGFDYKHKATLKNIDKIKIKIPINNKKDFDISIQKEIAQKSKMISQLKKELKLQFDIITNSRINLE
ncbi:N-6 DNA methylase [Tenacibaculum finnmarkense]|uniref:HsdM family class I SAM-dependent methyltransferase n=1 Tax=Tenacibaculum finnmarkense TaxID=2781243 RepID=UPI001EFC278B|nr:N-6 DNA methylase [Tenacibaculum finnmarkense]MCG8762944.1 N-6 DNA methylase [Tenacibaculum finnmarkense]MCG8788427.1 N-6 DNA methylase [Tenacibaculum finnmarkense]